MRVSDVSNLAQLLSFPLIVMIWAVTQGVAKRFWRQWGGPLMAILAVVTLSALWRLRVLQWVAGRFRVPAWLLLWVGVAGVLLLLAYWVLALAGAPRRDWRDYVSDEILGAVWHWRYLRHQVQEHHLTAFCPQSGCRGHLRPQANPDRPISNPGTAPIDLVCRHCGFKREFDADYETLKRRVITEIERRIDTGEFLKRLEEE